MDQSKIWLILISVIILFGYFMLSQQHLAKIINVGQESENKPLIEVPTSTDDAPEGSETQSAAYDEDGNPLPLVTIENEATEEQTEIERIENEIQPAESFSECTDSDGGRQYYMKGYTVGYWMAENTEVGSPPSTKLDWCTASTLTEMICREGTRMVGVTYDCQNGCDDGACVCMTNAECSLGECINGKCIQING